MSKFYFDPHNYDPKDNIFYNNEVSVGDIIIYGREPYIVTEKNIEIRYSFRLQAKFHLESHIEYDLSIYERIPSHMWLKSSIDFITFLNCSKKKYKKLSEEERNKFMELLE